ncbi:hypothetical protein P775_03660 [Puniceibacterium antarcticum]|uniref:Uncharacterized protein n=1 Tax=Puniceibacterium antarcticum TaxID=1206336 RepID=A0A2G8RJ46_9RHOB|nr:hypothetical protein P775_03660 [Puniceibacterium antarcticum]
MSRRRRFSQTLLVPAKCEPANTQDRDILSFRVFNLIAVFVSDGLAMLTMRYITYECSCMQNLSGAQLAMSVT